VRAVAEGGWVKAEQVDVRPGGEPVLFVLGGIAGTVRGDDVVGRKIRVWPLPYDKDQGMREATVGRDCSFEILGLPLGRYRISFVHNDARPHLMFEVDEVVAPARDLDLRAIPGARIEGTVVDEGGRPAEGVTVLAAAEDREDRDWRVTGADGRFVLQGLRAGTEYTIRGYVDEAVPWEGKATAPTTGLRLVIETGFHAAGRVVGAEGEPLAFTQLRFVAEGHEAPNAYCETDAQGRFEVAGLRDGAYRAQRYPKVVLKVDDPAPEWIDIGTVRARTRDVVLHAK